MDLVLTRNQKRSDGIFGQLRTASGQEFLMDTLEHAFPGKTVDSYEPAVPIGSYSCLRGMHKLSHSQNPFETFEVQNVPGHTGILFHVGNFNRDSSGCILLGLKITEQFDPWYLFNSRALFLDFMQKQSGLNEFHLTIVE